MNRKQLKARVDHWRGVLHLDHWDMNIEVVTAFDGSHDGAFARCLNEDDYDDTTLTFLDDWFRYASAADIDYAIVHEMLHVLMRDFDHAIDSIDRQLAPAVSEIWQEGVRHEREGIVDRLAKVIVALHGE